MLWLYLHFPNLALDHIRRTSENLSALVVVEGNGQTIYQACPKAHSLGVHTGMRLKTATNLAPDLNIVRADSTREASILEDQALWLYRHIAHIVLFPPDGILTEVGSMQRLYGGLPEIWKALQQALDERQLTARLGIGHTPLAARLIARAGKGECLATREHILRTLAALPLPAAEFDTRTCDRLQRLGLTTLGQVIDLPPAELARRLSPQTLAHLQRIQGTRPDPQTSWQPPALFHQQTDFAQDIEQSQWLLFPLRRMLSELEEDLRWRQQDTDSLQLELHHRHHEPTQLRIRTAGPEHRAEAFLSLIRLRLDQHPLQAPVMSLILSVSRFLGREASGGADLFGENDDQTEAWQALISRLQARLGRKALTQLSPQADHRPEKAWQTIKLEKKHRTDSGLVNYQYPDRPLWLLQEPHLLTEAPQAWLAGPERISSGWWDDQQIKRDYYVAQLSGGKLAWVFRDASSDWFVHGWFG